jgi:electron transport complex protein RnfC
MSAKTFPRGVHVPHNKQLTQNKPVKNAEEPGVVVIPMSQHIGAPCEPQVKAGDSVKVGQTIGSNEAFVSAPIHASVSGKVVAIEPRLHPSAGREVLSVVIESDGQGELHESVKPRGSLESLSPEEIRRLIREGGLVGLGGAGFPTAVKVTPPKDKKIDVFLLNGAECEPYLTADHRLMLERPEDVLFGMKALMKAVGVERGYICIEDNKPDAIQAMKAVTKGETSVQVLALRTKYPQGAEKQLIKAVLGREVPPPPGLPADVGVIVDNVGTAVALADIIKAGMPVVQRVVTVTGSVIAEPSNILAKVGTPFKELIAQCGGFKANPYKVIMGGPMMGISQYSLEVPVVKGTSGILALSKEEVLSEEPSACIRCSRCVDACPISLLPYLLAGYSERGALDEAEKLNVTDCIECGCCGFICPSRRPLVQSIRLAKAEVLSRRRKAAGR